MKQVLVLGVACFVASLESGQIVFDKEENGEPVKEAVFTVEGVEYETDSEGKIVDTSLKGDTTIETKEVKPDFLNPFHQGVSYDQFLASIPKGKSVAQYCKNKLTPDEIAWIETELEFHKQNKMPKPQAED